MSVTAKKVIDEALGLSAQERVLVVEQLLISLATPNPELDKLWAQEAEARLDAYHRGELKALSLQEVLAKYKTDEDQGS
ncbi:MAG TPA: addiction module protein [Candidatus Acidoferrum sp.]|nr:addiction module protein [Candidatus Acidoferrum sp.]